MKLSADISSSYKRPVIEAAILSSVFLVLSFMVLDGGTTAFASLFAVAGFWAAVLLMILRRPQSPTSVDVQVIRFGSLVAIVAAQFLARWIWHLRGVSLL